jgi:magnesium transporter
VIIDCAVYRDGERVADDEHRRNVAAAHAAADDGGGFLWIGLFEPTNAELQGIADELGLHRLAVEDAVKAHQRPKIERYGEGSIFLVLKTLRYDDAHDAVETGEIAVFLSERYIVTVRHGEAAQLEDVRHRAEEDLSILGNGPVAALYAILDEVVDRYEEVAAELETDVEEVEKSVFSPDRTHDSERIYRLKRETLEVRRAVLPLREPLVRFLHKDVETMSTEAMPFFRDVVDHLARVGDTVDSIDQLLDSALSSHLARLSIQQNEDTRKISAWGALLLVPTLVAGVYGMNFEHMPELGWRLGYPLAVLVMVVVSYALFRAFKRSGWL